VQCDARSRAEIYAQASEHESITTRVIPPGTTQIWND
jgi:hypothetical protein